MGQLDLRHTELLGIGNHSKVVLAPLTCPSVSSTCRTVAVKFSRPYADHKMLLNEAKIYNAFPRHLQDGKTPVVPKFYGYYVRLREVYDWDDGDNGVDDDLDEQKWKSLRTVLLNCITSILLLEACGKPVCDSPALSQRWARNFYNITLTEKGQAGHRETFEMSTRGQLCPGIILWPQHTRPARSAYPSVCRTQIH
jgi:hypothetical protein